MQIKMGFHSLSTHTLYPERALPIHQDDGR